MIFLDFLFRETIYFKKKIRSQMFKRTSFLRHQRARKTVKKLILAEQRLLGDERRTSK